MSPWRRATRRLRPPFAGIMRGVLESVLLAFGESVLWMMKCVRFYQPHFIYTGGGPVWSQEGQDLNVGKMMNIKILKIYEKVAVGRKYP